MSDILNGTRYPAANANKNTPVPAGRKPFRFSLAGVLVAVFLALVIFITLYPVLYAL